ncbi:MAG: hypothetical protein FWH22_10045, partial [Fibromonadales bacterium]|nr:hypothetical protein [Fibromonadales bacterium]
MSSLPFVKKLRWFFMRFRSERSIRCWFEKKSGGENEMFRYSGDISNYKRIAVFLPTEQDKFYAILPFVLALFEKRGRDNFLAITDESNRYVLRALYLEHVSLFYNKEAMLYGDPEFFEMEKRLQEQKWDLCLFLQENAELPYLYLARITRAPYRMGIYPDFPFLNIALQNSSRNDSIYANRNFLYKSFLIDSEKAENESVLATQKNEKMIGSQKLSTSNTLLLNLEPPVDGEPWEENEISMICRAFQPTWRMIAIAACPKRLELYSQIMEELDIRSNPVLLHSESIFSVLRQY